jgi:hypothetical protein
MFHARIVSPRGSLYFAAEATPYDLENLRTHIQDLQTRKRDVRLELSLDVTSKAAMDQQLSGLLRTLAAEGVKVRFRPEIDPGAPAATARVGRKAVR